jgi:hypothetical protein
MIRGLIKGFKLSWGLGYAAGYAKCVFWNERKTRIEEYQRCLRFLSRRGMVIISPEDMAALDAVDERGLHTVDEYVKAKKRIDKAKARVNGR